MECDELDCLPRVNACLKEDNIVVEESKANISSNGCLSPDLSNKNKCNDKIVNKLKRKRNTVIDENNTILSRLAIVLFDFQIVEFHLVIYYY